jgi:apolipoprotein N-acyltransferase
MDSLSTLQSLGLTLPSPAYIVGVIVFGLIGLAAFRRGRKTGRRTTLWLGVALMLYPYAISRTWLLYVVGAALCVGIYAHPGGTP